ncbi:ParB/RepB/Spo0J family partition protein [Sphingomonas quercus]|uniref:ParB/RepB/Spo0J family partition protein n=1 Tax=Sphingomonas quercus TaxID=2842451 RepID=A0ABS6BF62_9SPHN|nr:ParB/RepB/Spo0J family partition protein [Sphingomonas quercus]MBU3076937.1 ParB/RepB/Spo0J family partition protein [Sphingomonas quercus]
MSAAEPRRRPSGLGRGLSALFGEVAEEQSIAPGASSRPGVTMVPVSHMRPHPGQPRRHFDEAALAELAESIGQRGLIQPIVVRPHGSGEFQIVAGERRWRAAQRAQLHEVPVLIREFGDAETLEVALIENIQRQDLNAIEEAEAYQRLVDDYGHGQEDIGKLVGKSRSHIANLLRLLTLPESVRTAVADGRLSMGHARALVTAGDPAALAAEVIGRGLSVRETEALARGGAPARRTARSAKPAALRDADTEALERQLGDMLGLKVSIHHGEGGGNVTLAYSSLDQLDMICQRLSGGSI